MTARRRLLLVTNDLEVGGAQQFLVSLLGALDRDRFDVHVATVSGEGPLVEAVRDRGAGYVHVPVVRRWRRLRAIDPRGIGGLARVMRERRIDVMHGQLFLGNTIGRLAALRAGVPRILAAEHSTYFAHGPLHWRIDRVLARRTQRIVAISEEVARFIVARGIPAERVTVIPNGIALERFEKLPSPARVRARLGLAADALVLGSVGRLGKEKQIDTVLRLLPRVLERLPAAVFLVVGEGPERARLEALARAGGVARSVRFLGECSDVAELLPALDLFLHPSRREGLPTAVLEAMAAGVPPVVQDAAYARELVRDGIDGRLLDFGRPEASADALVALARDPRARAALRAGALHRARRFSIRETAAAWSRLYLPDDPA